ncbi:hypothetical protein ACFWDN_32420, partial [Micromonospora chalcea]
AVTKPAHAGSTNAPDSTANTPWSTSQWRLPYYAELVSTPDAEGHTGDVRWNFEKFLVAPDGTVAARFAPQVTPEDPELRAAIEKVLPA